MNFNPCFFPNLISGSYKIKNIECMLINVALNVVIFKI